MILKTKDGGIIASGPVTKNGGELTYIGQKNTPKYSFSIRTKNIKDENNDWKSEFLDCELWGEQAETAPELGKGDTVFVTGNESVRRWIGRDGDERISTSCKCDFLMCSSGVCVGTAPEPAPMPKPKSKSEATDITDFTELDDKDDLPF